jgi:glucose/arabinose dehydrogenase
VAVVFVAACTGAAQLPFSAGVGPDPRLPPADKELVPTVNIAEARGWPQGTVPQPAQGLRVTAFASGLDHPRWLHVLPNGDVLVAESNRPPKPEELQKGIRNRLMAYFMKKAGSAGKSANRITLLRDRDGDGVAEHREVFLENLNSPFGMALVGHELFVANADGIVKVGYDVPPRRSPRCRAARATTTGPRC